MGMLLAYELEKGTERELKSLAAALGHQVKMVSSSNYGEPLGYVAGITGFKKTNAKDTGEKIGSEMLIFCGLDSEVMDALLGAKASDSLKSGGDSLQHPVVLQNALRRTEKRT